MRTHHDQTLVAMNTIDTRNGGRMSIGEFVRQWGPCILTALIVPGGIVIALVLLWTRWSQRRQASNGRRAVLALALPVSRINDR
jgi:hypothetical protein